MKDFSIVCITRDGSDLMHSIITEFLKRNVLVTIYMECKWVCVCMTNECKMYVDVHFIDYLPNRISLIDGFMDWLPKRICVNKLFSHLLLTAIKNMQNNVMNTYISDSDHLVKLQTIEIFLFYLLCGAIALSSTYMLCV